MNLLHSTLLFLSAAVSPLIALMDDQAGKLTELGLRVARIHSGLPAGDFTGNGARLCGNTTTKNGLTTGPGCIIVFRQQYLSPLGSGVKKGN